MVDPANDNETLRQAVLDGIALKRMRTWTMVFDREGEAEKAAYMRGAVALLTGEQGATGVDFTPRQSPPSSGASPGNS